MGNKQVPGLGFVNRDPDIAAIAPARKAVVIVPDDDTDNVPAGSTVWVGTGGSVMCIPVDNEDDTPIPLLNISDGRDLPVVVRRVLATGTDAEDLVALYN